MESQAWQGSDYIRYDPTMCFSNGNDNSTIAPECADDDFDVDVITADMGSITNLYDSSLVRRPNLVLISDKRERKEIKWG